MTKLAFFKSLSRDKYSDVLIAKNAYIQVGYLDRIGWVVRYPVLSANISEWDLLGSCSPNTQFDFKNFSLLSMVVKSSGFTQVGILKEDVKYPSESATTACRIALEMRDNSLFVPIILNDPSLPGPIEVTHENLITIPLILS